MSNIYLWLRPIAYLMLVVVFCLVLNAIIPKLEDLPVKQIKFSTFKNNVAHQSKVTSDTENLIVTSTPESNKDDSLVLATMTLDFLNQKNHKSKNPVIRYYTKPLDGQSVYQLNKYGFYVHERKTNNLNQFKSNVIHYGDSVGLDKIKIISFVLMSSGLDIKEIAPSRYHAGWKYNSIEVGADTTLLKNPSISYTYLNNLK